MLPVPIPGRWYGSLASAEGEIQGQLPPELAESAASRVTAKLCVHIDKKWRRFLERYTATTCTYTLQQTGHSNMAVERLDSACVFIHVYMVVAELYRDHVCLSRFSNCNKRPSTVGYQLQKEIITCSVCSSEQTIIMYNVIHVHHAYLCTGNELCTQLDYGTKMRCSSPKTYCLR